MTLQQNRPKTAPDFLLSRPEQSLRTQGCRAIFPDPFDAATALSSGEAEMIVGAIPFDTSLRAALCEPESIVRSEGPLEPPAIYRGKIASESLKVRSVSPVVSRDAFHATVMSAINTIRMTRLQKIVLARPVDIEFEEPAEPLLVAARLIDLSANRDGYAVDLGTTGRKDDKSTMFVGSSPEVLIRRKGMTITAFPMAGSAARSSDRFETEMAAAKLADSRKNLAEHKFVVDHYRRILEPLCSTLEIADEPQIHLTSEMIHLGTPIKGELKDPQFSALDLALMLHPTPAVGGTPTPDAIRIIEDSEEPREFYAGLVGWCDASGDGEYMVAIRCCVIDGERARAWAGGGVVADSQPSEETRETTAKLQTVLRALNVPASMRDV